jgi:hypothetical protein
VHCQLPQPGDLPGDAAFAEFHLFISESNLTALADWPLPGFDTTTDFLAALDAVATGITPLTLSQNGTCTRLFNTVIVSVMSSNPAVDASVAAMAVVNQVNRPSLPMQNVLLQAMIISGNYTDSAVPVPPMFHAPVTNDSLLYKSMGGVGAFLMILQFFYGLYHFRGFDFITSSKNER